MPSQLLMKQRAHLTNQITVKSLETILILKYKWYKNTDIYKNLFYFNLSAGVSWLLLKENSNVGCIYQNYSVNLFNKVFISASIPSK